MIRLYTEVQYIVMIENTPLIYFNYSLLLYAKADTAIKMNVQYLKRCSEKCQHFSTLENILKA